MNLVQKFLTKNDCYKTGKTIKPKGFMLHSTGANNPNVRRYVSDNGELLGKNTNSNDWNRSGIEKCVHGFIGKDKDGNIITVQTLPWTMRGWHGGGKSNDTHIGVEICEDNLKDAEYFNKVYKEAVELVVMLAKEYKWEINENTVICHCEGYKKGIASNHGDVMHWFPKHGKSMDTFRADVKAMLEAPEEKKEEATYTVKVTADSLNVRSGPGTNYKVVTTVKKNQVYTIVETSNNWGKLKSGAGWICLDYTKKNATTTTATTTTVKTPVPYTMMTVTAKNGLSVRKGPGILYKRVTVLKNGTKVKIYSINKAPV